MKDIPQTVSMGRISNFCGGTSRFVNVFKNNIDAMFDMFKKLKDLNFPKGEYVVAGGTMEAHGIRPAHDLDILVTPGLYRKLYKEGWKQCLCDTCLSHGRLMLNMGDVDILPDWTYGNHIGDVRKLIRNAVLIKGFPFMQLNDFMKLKLEIGRPKDFADDKLVKAYLKKHKNK